MRLRIHGVKRGPFALALAALVVVSLAGCERFVPPAVFDMESVNVGRLPENWPEGQELTEAQEEVLAERGKPDFIRARWDAHGRLSTGDELWTRYRRQRVVDIMLMHHHHDLPLPFEISWIYQAPDQERFQRGPEEVFRGDEVIFLNNTEYDVQPVSDQLGVVLDHGDPEEIRASEHWQGHLMEHWVYFHAGLIFHFFDGRIDRVERIAQTPIRVRREI
jgi:hypothetical protein